MLCARLAGGDEVVGPQGFVDLLAAPSAVQKVAEHARACEAEEDGAALLQPAGAAQGVEEPRHDQRATGGFAAVLPAAESGRAQQR